MTPPMAPNRTTKENDNKESATASCLDTPTLAKYKAKRLSLRPNPPSEIGRSVIAPIIGRKIK